MSRKGIEQVRLEIAGKMSDRRRADLPENKVANTREYSSPHNNLHSGNPVHQKNHPNIREGSHFAGKNAPEIRTLETAYREQPEKNVFHPYKKTGFLGRLSKKIERHGYPPLPIIALVGIVVFAAILPLISSAIFFSEPMETDVYVSIYSQKGAILKDILVVLASPDYSKIERSEAAGKDGLAYFRMLPVNAKYAIYAEKADGERISLEDRELKVPFPRGRGEIIIEIRSTS